MAIQMQIILLKEGERERPGLLYKKTKALAEAEAAYARDGAQPSASAAASPCFHKVQFSENAWFTSQGFGALKGPLEFKQRLHAYT